MKKAADSSCQLPGAGCLRLSGELGCFVRNFHRHFVTEKLKTESLNASQFLNTQDFSLIFLLLRCVLLCTSRSLVMPRACLSPHSQFSPGFCASRRLTQRSFSALLNTSNRFALSWSHCSASPTFPFLLHPHTFFLIVLPASQPVRPPFWCPDPLCLFPLQLPVVIRSLPSTNSADCADPRPLPI